MHILETWIYLTWGVIVWHTKQLLEVFPRNSQMHGTLKDFNLLAFHYFLYPLSLCTSLLSGQVLLLLPRCSQAHWTPYPAACVPGLGHWGPGEPGQEASCLSLFCSQGAHGGGRHRVLSLQLSPGPTDPGQCEYIGDKWQELKWKRNYPLNIMFLWSAEIPFMSKIWSTK